MSGIITDQNVAYHEAGHAVMFFYCNRSWEYVTIMETEKWGGAIKSRWRATADYDKRLEWDNAINEMECSLAGQIAYQIDQGDEDNQPDWEHSGGDIQNVLDLICELIHNKGTRDDKEWDDEVYPLFEWMRARTRSFLEDPVHWAAVDALAKELIKKRRIEYIKCVRIIQDATAAHLDAGRAIK